MAVKWIEPQMVFEISFQATTHQQHFMKMQVDSFAKTGGLYICSIFAYTSSLWKQYVEIRDNILFFFSKYCPLRSSHSMKEICTLFSHLPHCCHPSPKLIQKWRRPSSNQTWRRQYMKWVKESMRAPATVQKWSWLGVDGEVLVSFAGSLSGGLSFSVLGFFQCFLNSSSMYNMSVYLKTDSLPKERFWGWRWESKRMRVHWESHADFALLTRIQ